MLTHMLPVAWGGGDAMPNRLFDTDAQVRPLPSVALGLCAGQLRR
jgi:hypothetical protein